MLIQNASWITMEGAASTVVPVFRRTFSCSMPVRSATLEVTCDGVYEAVMNGSRVGEFILAPGWTEYRRRLQVQSYDVKELLTEKNIPLINHVHYSEPNLKMLRQREEHREIKRILDENGYENYISIEMRMPERSRDVLTAVEYLRSL